MDEHPGPVGASGGDGRTGSPTRQRAQCRRERRIGSGWRGSLLITGLKGAECSPGQAGFPVPVLQSETVPNQKHLLEVRHKLPQTQGKQCVDVRHRCHLLPHFSLELLLTQAPCAALKGISVTSDITPGLC